MPATIRFFRDRLTIDHDLIAKIAIGARDATLVLGAREMELKVLPASYHDAIAADRLSVPPNAGTMLIGNSPRRHRAGRRDLGRLEVPRARPREVPRAPAVQAGPAGRRVGRGAPAGTASRRIGCGRDPASGGRGRIRRARR